LKKGGALFFNKNMSKTTKKTKKVVEETVVETTQKAVTETPAEEVAVEKEVIKEIKPTRVRGKKYQAARKLIDINKYYSLKEAVALVKKASISKFDGKIEAHVTTIEAGNIGEITFPHLETVSKKIVILNDTILAEIKDGKIDFDILIATPVTMGKLLPFARVLGPRGLMPNPKAGTLTDKPEEAVKRLSVAKTMVKTEKQSPAIHLVVGKVSQPEVELIANIEELIKVVKPTKIKKLVLCPTMGPGIKVEIVK